MSANFTPDIDMAELGNAGHRPFIQPTQPTGPPPRIRHTPNNPEPPRTIQIGKNFELGPFDGSRATLPGWIFQAQIKLEWDLSEFDEKRKVAFLFGSLRGIAVQNMSPWYAAGLRGRYELTSENFFSQLKVLFASHHLEQEAKAALSRLNQGKKPFSRHFADFSSLLLEAGGDNWEEHTKIDALRRTLNDEMLSHSISSVRDESDLAIFAEQLQAASNRIESVRIAKDLRVDYQASWRQSGIARGGVTRTPPDMMDWESTRQARQARNDTDQRKRRAAWVSRAERHRQRQLGLCIQCGASGHFASDCPHLPPQRPLRQKVSVRRVDEQVEAVLEDEGSKVAPAPEKD